MRVPDLALGSHQSLRHGRLRHKEGSRDLGRAQTAQEPEGQRHLHTCCERRVTAGEDQPQTIVLHRALLDRLLGCMQERRLGVAIIARGLAAQAVDRSIPSGGDDPARRRRRQSAVRPPRHRDRERLLDRVLGDVEIPEDAGQDGHRPPVLLAEDKLDLGMRDA